MRLKSLQPLIEARGLEIFSRMHGEKPSAFSPRSLTGRLLDWSMRNEALKVQLFRFVDVLASLKSPEEIARHAAEYLGDGIKALPAPLRWGIRHADRAPRLTAMAARAGVSRMAETFILAADERGALPRLRRMRKLPIGFTVDILGETAVSEKECDEYQEKYLRLINALAEEAEGWKAIPQIDQDDQGPIPRANVSVKISALYSQIHPADLEGSIRHLSGRLLPLLARARQKGVFINFDMESTALKNLTLELFKRLLDQPELQDYPHAGIALQAYLLETEKDLRELIAWAQQRDRHITVRLIKGAYWDYETVLARQRNWPAPVFQHKNETDAHYERLARLMLENRRFIRCAFGTHSVRSIASCMAHAEELRAPLPSCEFQMLYGMAEPIKMALVKMGCRVRDYCPVGEILPGMSYLVRRLLENTSNEGFLRATFSEGQSPEELLRDPAELITTGQAPAPARPASVEAAKREKSEFITFQNEPLLDFTIPENRSSMSRAIEQVNHELGARFPLWIGDHEIQTEAEIVSINPARPDEIVGRVAQAGIVEAEAALAGARAQFSTWSKTPVEQRAALLERTADLLRRERFSLAALEMFETGKNWTESDADLVEAIDFCRFYASEMRRIASSSLMVPGEANLHHYMPRGVAVVIAPWNFPLGILCGMTAAALVAGNCALVKPSGQSVVLAARFFQLLREAGFPPGVINFVPGSGAEIGDYLVQHPLVDLIAFTGSREVGLRIWEQAGITRPGQKHLKKVICEMGGKNAVIVDSDADLDEAIPGIVSSAFGYQGQKCSALSRLILLEENHDRVVERLIEATRSLAMGPPEDPGTMVGPVIDQKAQTRIERYIETGRKEGRLAFQGRAPQSNGFFIPPAIFTGVAPDAAMAQEEIFGPVLAVLKARDLGEAIAWANGTKYGLTGGFFSRSPANIERVRSEFEVGNLYINRGITGAIVGRHPFGGFKMSGGGTKAGGADYLLNFLFPRAVAENLMRRGFAPGETGGPGFFEARGE